MGSMDPKDGQGPTEVDETPEGQEEKTPPSNAFDLPDDHPVIKELARARKEAAASREKKNQANSERDEEAKKWREHVASQKSELDRATEKATDLESQLKELRQKELRRDIAKEFGLDDDLSELLVGEEDQMKTTAEKLSERLKNPGAKTDHLLGGDRGAPVRKKEKSNPLDQWINY